MKMRPVGVELLHEDRRTERHEKAICRFSKFCERGYKKAFLIDYRFFLKRTGNAIDLNVSLFQPSRWCASIYRKIFYRRHISAVAKHWALFGSVHI